MIYKSAFYAFNPCYLRSICFFKNMKRSILLLIFALVFSNFAAAQNNRFTIQELLKLRRVAAPAVSPDGRFVAFQLGDVNKDANRVVNQIYITPATGGELRALTSGAGSSLSPAFSPDGKKIAYISGGQIWTMDADDGEDKKQITSISTGVNAFVWSPDGRMFAFSSDVYPECRGDENCNKQKDAAAEANKVKAHVTERLLYKHWNEWRDVKRTHVFLIETNGDRMREATTGDWDSPPYGASSFVDFGFSPDSRELVFLRNPDRIEAISTNSDVYIAPVSNPDAAKNITATNKGYDASPVYTRDGKYILYRSQMTEGFEADRWRLMRYDRQTGRAVEIPVGFDLQVEDFVITPDSQTIYFTAAERGRGAIYTVPLAGGRPRRLMFEGFASDLKLAGNSLVFTHASGRMPPEIARVNTDGSGMTNLTTVNQQMLSQYNLQKLEDFEWTGAGNAKIHGFITKPANFDPNKKYPLFVLIHGGPQSASNDAWSNRWNSQVFANAGYIVFSPNPRGSVGYGQQFVNEVSADWGGRAFTDIMNGVAEIIKKPYIDKNRLGAAGASYGGYMVDWILGHNNDPRFKFKVFVSHAGVYNLESMAGATEELWFINYEFKGMPWQNPVNYNKWSPHKFAKNFNTPTLVTAGELDFRVPVDQSMQLFTALQLNNVPSKLIVYPDEGHWILKPQNSEFWYTNVLDWFDKHINNQ